MIVRPNRWFMRSRRAAAAAELALTLPVLMLIVLGAVDFGRFLFSYIAVSNGARAGAGVGSMSSYTTASLVNWQGNIRNAVIDDMGQMYGFDASQLTVTSTGVTEANGDWRAEVEVVYPFQMIISWPGMPNTLTLRRTVSMRAIR